MIDRGWGPWIFPYIFFLDVSYTYLRPFFCYSVLCWWYHHSPLPRVYKQNNEREANLYLFPHEGSSSEFLFQKCFACLVRTKHICYSYRHIQFAFDSAPNERAFRYKSSAGWVRWNCSITETFRSEEVFQVEVLEVFWPKSMRYLLRLPRVYTQGFSEVVHFIHISQNRAI